MPRNALTRMDVDTGWVHHRRVRALQRQHPERWPIYWAAYLVLLAEAWHSRSRSVRLADAWVVALPCSLDEATTALRKAGMIDRAGRVPVASWDEWYGPTEARLEQARRAIDSRWSKGRNGAEIRPYYGGSTNSQPASQASISASARVCEGCGREGVIGQRHYRTTIAGRRMCTGTPLPLSQMMPPPPGYERGH